jgi:hypothetical protein
MTDETLTELTQRQKLVAQLADDLDSQGWDQHSKVYAIKGDPDDEYLELLATFDEDLVHYLEVHLNEHPNVKATGMLVTGEIWMYPRGLIEGMPLQARPSYLRLMPPHSHEDRVDGRVLTLVATDGELLELVVRKGETDKDWSDTPARLGAPESIIQPIRYWLNMSPGDAAGMPSLDMINAITQQAGKECWSEEQLIAVILTQLPQEERDKYVAHLRPDMKRKLGIDNA